MTLAGDSHRVLIVSSHSLFSEGLTSLIRQHQPSKISVVGSASDPENFKALLKKHSPDLVIVDHSDDLIRKEVLTHFVDGDDPLRVVVVSLREAGHVTVYDRRVSRAMAVEDWLSDLAPQRVGAELSTTTFKDSGETK
jgi:DNA-binding NarL/FixJ family response regulator